MPGNIYNVVSKQIGFDGTEDTGDWGIKHTSGYIAIVDATTRCTCFTVL